MAEQGRGLLRGLEQSEAGAGAGAGASDGWLWQLHILLESAAGGELAASLTNADLALVARFGFDGGRDTTRVQLLALGFLNNVMILHAPMKHMFVDARLPEKAIKLLNKDSEELGELAAALLLRVSQHLRPYLESHHLANAIYASVNHCAIAAGKHQLGASHATRLSLLSALVTQYYAHAHRFLGSLGRLFDTLEMSDVCPESPLEQPVVQLIECLAALLPWSSRRVFPRVPRPSLADKLVDILDSAIRAYRTQGDFEARITPLVSAMCHVSGLSPTVTIIKCSTRYHSVGSAGRRMASVTVGAKEKMQSRLLATDRDRRRPLGTGDSLPHLVVAIATEAATALKTVLAGLLFELSDGDQDRLVDNVGPGCAAGLLQCLAPVLAAPMPSVESEAAATNPIAGQLRDMERGVQEARLEMTRVLEWLRGIE